MRSRPESFRDGRRSLPETTAFAGFLLLVPGFLLYHFAVAAYGMPAILGGLFGLTSAALVIIFLIEGVCRLRELVRRAGAYGLFVAVFFAYAIVWTTAHWVLVDESYIEPAVRQSIETIVMWTALFFVGMYLPVNSVSLNRFLVALLLAATVWLAWYVAKTGDVMFYARRVYDAEAVASYQGFSRSLALVGLFAFATFRGIKLQFNVALFAIFSLFVLGARSELYGFLAILAATVVINGFVVFRYWAAAAGAILVVGIVVSGAWDYMVASRQLEVLDLSTAGSWQTRVRLAEEAWSQIVGSPLFGRFGGHIEQFNTAGSYAHNAQSAWVTYGLFGGLMYILLTVIAVMSSARRLLQHEKRGGGATLAFLVNGFSLILMIAAKPVFWPIPALGWGLYTRMTFYGKRYRVLSPGTSDYGGRKR